MRKNEKECERRKGKKEEDWQWRMWQDGEQHWPCTFFSNDCRPAILLFGMKVIHQKLLMANYFVVIANERCRDTNWKRSNASYHPPIAQQKSLRQKFWISFFVLFIRFFSFSVFILAIWFSGRISAHICFSTILNVFLQSFLFIALAVNVAKTSREGQREFHYLWCC